MLKTFEKIEKISSAFDWSSTPSVLLRPTATNYKRGTRMRGKKNGLLPRRVCHLVTGSAAAGDPLLRSSSGRHTSAALTARSLTRRRCTAQHSCLLSASSHLDLLLPRSLPSFVSAQHASDILPVGHRHLYCQVTTGSGQQEQKYKYKQGFVHVYMESYEG